MVKPKVVVAGLGGMGSAAAAQLALRDASVIGIEQFRRGHALGASSGESRVIRRAYFEHPAYVPLLDRAYQLWHDLESTSGTQLLELQGCLTAGFHGSPLVAGAEEAVRLHDLDAELLEATDIHRRYPALRVRDDEYGVFEPEGGMVFPEAAIDVCTTIAQERGAELRFDTGLVRWESERDGVRIHLSDGTSVLASRLVLTLGPWFGDTLRALGVSLRIQRNVAAWFEPALTLGPTELPTFLIHRREWPAPFYGFPDIGGGTKASFHGLGVETEPLSLDRTIGRERDVDPIAAAFEAWVPGASHTYLRAKACMYAMTPDGHFVIDVHPADPRVIVCGGFSGHGFKFASVVGEIAADLALD